MNGAPVQPTLIEPEKEHLRDILESKRQSAGLLLRGRALQQDAGRPSHEIRPRSIAAK